VNSVHDLNDIHKGVFVTDGETTQLRRRGRNRQAILDAALELIEQSGVDGWSMRELAGRVDYTPGALYRYFDSKSALLEALTSDAMQQLRARLAESGSDDGPLATLEELGLAYLDFAATRPTLFRLGLVQMPSRRTSLSTEPSADSPYAVVLAAVRAAVEADEIAADTAFTDEHIAFTIWATVHGMAVLEQTHLRGFDADFAAIHRPALRRLIAGLASGA
jgi:AcrR family transcriptional regulator